MMDPKRLARLSKQLNTISRRLMRDAAQIRTIVNIPLLDGANKMRNRVIEGMTREAKHGRWYNRGRRKHRASAPGEYPASDYGNMVKSLEFELGEMEVEFGTVGAPYAELLELGTPKGQMAPRPWLANTADEMAPDIANDVMSHTGNRIARSFQVAGRWWR